MTQHSLVDPKVQILLEKAQEGYAVRDEKNAEYVDNTVLIQTSNILQ